MLDTHVMIWWAAGNRKLSAGARELIADDANAIMVSVASVWEIAIKSRLPRRDTGTMSAIEFVNIVGRAGFDLLDVEPRHALGVEGLPHVHGDPFDRLLVATAYADTYRLLTADRALAAYGDHVLLI